LVAVGCGSAAYLGRITIIVPFVFAGR
jgi:hypothetical protein